VREVGIRDVEGQIVGETGTKLGRIVREGLKFTGISVGTGKRVGNSDGSFE